MRGTARRWALALGGLALGSSGSQADALPVLPPRAGPVPKPVQSVEITDRDEPLYQSPGLDTPRRGAAQLGVRLPLFGVTRAPGCAGRWLHVGPLAWVCETRVRLSTQPAQRAVQRQHFPDGLPYRYYFVGRDGSFGYKNLAVAEEGVPDAQLEPSFAVAVVQVARKSGGDPFGLTSKGLWLPMRDLNSARENLFRGVELNDPNSRVGWVTVDSANVYASPNGKRLSETRTRFESVRVLESVKKAGRLWHRVADNAWLRQHDLNVSSASALPSSVAPGERWLDIDLTNQILTAYQGERPLFATLVSTGKGKGKSTQATPPGEFRVWVKLLSSDMDNLENEEASRYYAIQDVPWVMYFKQGYGLHGTFWHRSFGHVRSHGCVNLAPLDAERLFHWTSPRLPSGWTAALPTAYEPGTLVRIR